MATSWSALQADILTDLNAKRVLVADYTTPTGVAVRFKSLREVQDYIDWLDRKVNIASKGIASTLGTF